MPDKPAVEYFQSSNGALIFRLPLEVFVGYVGYAHLVAHEGYLALIDTGSGLGSSHRDLLDGLATVRDKYGVDARPECLKRVVLTHGHIDHFGGLNALKETAPQAAVAVHELDRPVLVNYEERVLTTRRAMMDFLQRAGVPAERRAALLEMYMLGKRTFLPSAVDLTLHDGDLIDGLLRVIHVPGHTPGQVMLQIDNVLLTADHILPETSVALAPESIMPYTGVGHYVESLAKAGQVGGVHVALGGHEAAVHDYYALAQRTREASLEKVQRVYDHCDEPRTIYEIAQRIYGSLGGYGELLKIEQTGARIEYLNQRGLVMIENLGDLEGDHSPALRYRRV